MPISCVKSSFTKLSASSRPDHDVERTPISFNSLILSTPRSNPNWLSAASPVIISNARLNLDEKMGKSEGELGLTGCFLKLLLGLCLIFMAKFGFSCGVSEILQPVLNLILRSGLFHRQSTLGVYHEGLQGWCNHPQGSIMGGRPPKPLGGRHPHISFFFFKKTGYCSNFGSIPVRPFLLLPN